jgi:uncharacterized protein
MATPLDHAQYLNLETFKKNGEGVKTPVWAAPLEGKLVVFSEGKAFKVKRIRNNGKARVAPCNVSGKLLGGWHEATARVVEGDPEFERRAYRALRDKYGWQMRTLDFFSFLAGKKDKRALIEISLT